MAGGKYPKTGVPYGIVLDDNRAGTRKDLCTLLPPFLGIRNPRGVLGIRDAVEESLSYPRQGLLRRLRVGPLCFEFNRHEERLVEREDLDCAEIPRTLDRDPVIRIDQDLADKIETLLRPAGNEDFVR